MAYVSPFDPEYREPRDAVWSSRGYRSAGPVEVVRSRVDARLLEREAVARQLRRRRQDQTTSAHARATTPGAHYAATVLGLR